MISKETIQNFLLQEFPQSEVTVERLTTDTIWVRQAIDQRHLRPGGTVSGPVLMAVADVAMYVAVLSQIGLVALAVTTNLSINFLRKPAADKAIIAQCRLLKSGKRMLIGEVNLFSEGDEVIVAHAVITYSVPPANGSPILN